MAGISIDDYAKNGGAECGRQKTKKKTITLQMADQGRSDVYAVFTRSLSALELKQLLISLLFQIMQP